jgi:hypothetical protein
MPEMPGGVRPDEHISSEQDPSITVKPLFAEDRQRHFSKRGSSGVGLLLHQPVNEVVKVSDIMSAVDAMLLDMALHGYVQPVAQSEVISTLKEIRRAGKLDRSASSAPEVTRGPSRKKP